MKIKLIIVLFLVLPIGMIGSGCTTTTNRGASIYGTQSGQKCWCPDCRNFYYGEGAHVCPKVAQTFVSNRLSSQTQSSDSSPLININFTIINNPAPSKVVISGTNTYSYGFYYWRTFGSGWRYYYPRGYYGGW